MATFEKDFVKGYGSLDKFAQEDGCYKIYESDTNYHTVRKPQDEQGILSSPYVKNPRLITPSTKYVTFFKAQRSAHADHGSSSGRREAGSE